MPQKPPSLIFFKNVQFQVEQYIPHTPVQKYLKYLIFLRVRLVFICPPSFPKMHFFAVESRHRSKNFRCYPSSQIAVPRLSEKCYEMKKMLI